MRGSMYKLLIVDDEPLIQVGIKSMLNWEEMGVEICGTAMNGQAAINMIEDHSPDIVITDIKMPVMDGLELIRICRERYGNDRPYFIILTSYEDFHMAKEALTYQVSDYLVKLELTPENLRAAIEKVLQKVHLSEENDTSVSTHLFYDKFFISLLHNLFESEDQFLLQSRDLKLDFHYAVYVCCYGELCSRQGDSLPANKQLSLYSASLRMIRELVVKYRFCYALSLDMRHLALIFCYEESISDIAATYSEEIVDILRHVSTALENYYNVTLYCGVGNPVETTSAISDSYQCSRMAYHETSSPHTPTIRTFEQCTESLTSHNFFHFGLFKSGLIKAFEEYDPEILTCTINDICELFTAHPQYHVQALDAACNILYLSISLLQNGEAIVSEIFKDSPDGYRSIYRQSSVEQVVSWLQFFSEKMAELFESRRKDYKNHIVTNVKKYINEHVQERLSLNEVAAVFGISPNYLSQLFGKYNEIGFSEYINHCKIAESKKLLEEGNLKVYEVAEMLGFESAFYFSKVFKKLEGVSPTDYVNNKLL